MKDVLLSRLPRLIDSWPSAWFCTFLWLIFLPWMIHFWTVTLCIFPVNVYLCIKPPYLCVFSYGYSLGFSYQFPSLNGRISVLPIEWHCFFFLNLWLWLNSFLESYPLYDNYLLPLIEYEMSKPLHWLEFYIATLHYRYCVSSFFLPFITLRL